MINIINNRFIFYYYENGNNAKSYLNHYIIIVREMKKNTIYVSLNYFLNSQRKERYKEYEEER